MKDLERIKLMKKYGVTEKMVDDYIKQFKGNSLEQQAKEPVEDSEQQIKEQQPKRSAEDIIAELKRLNPYPEDVFIPIPDNKFKAIQKLLKDNSYSSDCLYGNWGRYVWDNCVKKAEELFEDYANECKE